MTKPISVVITSYNQRRFLSEAIKSVLSQYVTPKEIIICDDNSTDGSRDMLRKYEKGHDNIELIFQDKNVGVAKNRNTGLKEATQPFISILDGDDWYSANKLEKEYNALKDGKYGWAYSKEKIANKMGEFKHKKRLNESNGKTGDIFRDIVLKEISPKHWMMRKRALEDVGYLDEDFRMYEDWEFKVRLSHNHKAIFCPDSSIFYRQHSSGIHTSSKRVFREEKRKFYNKILHEKRDQLPRLDNFLKEVRKFFRDDYMEVEKSPLWEEENRR